MATRSLTLSCLFLAVAWAQGKNDPVVIGEIVSLPSQVLKETRTLLISKPAGYDIGNERYPVLYLLDAETHIRYASGIASFLAANDRLPKMLLVGIVSGTTERRTRDLTPPSASEIDNRFSPGNGGGRSIPVLCRRRTDSVRGQKITAHGPTGCP